MLKTLSILIAASALASPALAETFVHDGVTYVYSVEQRGAVKIITGEDANTRKPFKLVVRNGRVQGTVGNMPVSFSTRDVVRVNPRAISTEVASR